MDEHPCLICGHLFPTIGLAIHHEDSHLPPHELSEQQNAAIALVNMIADNLDAKLTH